MIPVAFTEVKKERIMVDSGPMTADGITIVIEAMENVKENASGKETETAMTEIATMRGTY